MATVELEIRAPIAVLWLNRAEVANAINAQMLTEFRLALDQVARRAELRVLLLRGRGGQFCAGADLRELSAEGLASGSSAEDALPELLELLANLPLAVVGVLERFALGGGFLFSLCCDWRIATPATRLGFSKLARHWVPPCGLSRLAEWVGPARARQILIARATLTAEDALGLGLVDEIVAPEALEAAVTRRERDLADIRPDVVREVRAFFANSDGSHLDRDRRSAGAFSRTFGQPETLAAVQEFLRGARNRP